MSANFTEKTQSQLLVHRLSGWLGESSSRPQECPGAALLMEAFGASMEMRSMGCCGLAGSQSEVGLSGRRDLAGWLEPGHSWI